jgi:hypothetical protein
MKKKSFLELYEEIALEIERYKVEMNSKGIKSVKVVELLFGLIEKEFALTGMLRADVLRLEGELVSIMDGMGEEDEWEEE